MLRLFDTLGIGDIVSSEESGLRNIDVHVYVDTVPQRGGVQVCRLIKTEVPMMISRLLQIQFLLLFVFVLCWSIAGAKDGPFWFTLVALTLGALTVAGMIAQRRG